MRKFKSVRAPERFFGHILIENENFLCHVTLSHIDSPSSPQIHPFRDEEGVFRFSDGTTFTKTSGDYGSDDITW